MAAIVGADDIRRFANRQYLEPARARGDETVSIRSGDVHAAMGLQNRLPAVCGALGTARFCDENRLERLRIEGPANSSTTIFVFRLL